MFRRFLDSKLFPLSMGLCLTLLSGWLQVSHNALFHNLQDRVENLAYDLRFNATLEPKPGDNRIVIVDIDEKSLRELGHWPWPRDKLALMLHNLFAAGAAVVGFDIMFPNPESNPALQVLDKMRALAVNNPRTDAAVRELSGDFDYDARFGAAMNGGDTVLGVVFHPTGTKPTGALPPPPTVKIMVPPQKTNIVAMPNYSGNIPLLQKHASGAGFLTTFPDSDGVIRRTPLVLRYHDHIYPSLSLEVARTFLLLDSYTVMLSPGKTAYDVDGIRLGEQIIPTDAKGQVVVPFRGPTHTFRYISAVDAISGKLSPQLLGGAIVLVGTSAQGLVDVKATPVDPVFPGVEVHANVIAAMLDNVPHSKISGGENGATGESVLGPRSVFPSRPAWASGANFTILVGVGVLLALTLPFLSPWWLLGETLAIAATLVAFNIWIWTAHGLILNIASPLILVFVIAIPNMTYGLLHEIRRRAELKTMFGQYVPPQLVEEMSHASGGSFGFEGESRTMSVLFADIRSFTTISESLSPTELKDMLNLYFTHMTRIIFDHQGTIDKYVGDMIMAFWGAPLADPAHKAHAIEAALAMLARTEELRPEFERLGLPQIHIGVGINTGTMNVGDMGSTYRRAYTVLGDSVNLASRLEGLTKVYGVGLIVGEETRRELDARFVFRQLDLVRVKGKTEPVTIFEPICPRSAATPELLEEMQLNEAAFAHYVAGEFEQARLSYTRLGERCPRTKLYRIYRERIDGLLLQPPAPGEWNGVYVLTTK